MKINLFILNDNNNNYYKEESLLAAKKNMENMLAALDVIEWEKSELVEGPTDNWEDWHELKNTVKDALYRLEARIEDVKAMSPAEKKAWVHWNNLGYYEKISMIKLVETIKNKYA